MKTQTPLTFLLGILLIASSQGFGQTNLEFTATQVTDEGAIQLQWQSQTNKIYRIDYTDTLTDGGTAWTTLYDDYPSHGTNTFWLDTGNYNLAPAAVHPQKTPLRFYRVVEKGADTTSSKPRVVITAPTNGALVSGGLTITVAANTDQPVLAGTKLYVDGQEMRRAISTTNYVVGSTNYEVDTYTINTCEWENGAHILFATVECESGFGDVSNSGPIASGRAVSAYVSVNFNNLVTSISFSQPSFDPSSGQTQRVSAVFALDSSWTLTIRNAFSNAVRTVSGSGTEMQFNWDGNGDGGANLPAGIYFYYFHAQTNSQAFARTAAATTSTTVTPLNAVALNSEFDLVEVTLPPLPPDLAEDEPETMLVVRSSHLKKSGKTKKNSASATVLGGVSMFGSPVFTTPLPSPQDPPPTPDRPPTNPVRGLAGTFGLGYDTYSANGTNGFSLGPLDNGLHVHQNIGLGTNTSGSSLNFSPLEPYRSEADNFITQMQRWGWQNTLHKVDDQLSINDLKGSGSPFNQVNLAILLFHGEYGTGLDYAANQCKQMYFPVTSGSSAQYLRMSEMNWGGAGTNGLKWLAINACNSLYQVNWNNMKSKGIKPYNSNLHLLLGSDTISFTSAALFWNWAKYINYGTSTNYSPLTVRAAWYQAAKDAFHYSTFTNLVKFTVAGDAACQNDLIQTNYTPGGTWFIDTPVQVHPFIP
jgi:hypothetical protein